MGLFGQLLGWGQDREAARLFNLGAAYARGDRGLPQDDRQAAHFYKLAADRGLTDAQFYLATFHESGRGGLPQDDRQAAHFYKLAADRGFAAAQYCLGYFYQQGRGGLPQDDRQAARLYKLAADHGNAGAQFSLGRFHQEGRGGLPQDDRQAARLYKLVADQGFAPAKDALIELRKGQDREEQPRQRKAAAEAGARPERGEDVRASLAIESGIAASGGSARVTLPGGRTVEVMIPCSSAKDALQLRLPGLGLAGQNGGEAGDALITVAIALVDEAPPAEAKYEDLPGDDPEAARLFIKLVAERGDAEAQYNLARFYKLGRGGLPKDKQEAERLFKLAADQGHAAAQKELFDASFAYLEKLSREGSPDS